MSAIDLTGLAVRPAQVWGGIRLVPLVRDEPVPGLRLAREAYGEGYTSVRVGPRTEYVSYVPHGFVASWGEDAEQSAAYGTRLGTARELPRVPVRRHHRMAKRRLGDRLRFLPLHLALDGYLALHFGGPSTVWEEWSRRALSEGLSPRVEDAYLGASVRGLAEALRIFEIHPGQCGVLLYAADALAGAFVVPHPDDYRALHPSLIQDLYGETVHHHAFFGGPVPDFEARIADGPHLRSVADLRSAALAQERAWARAHDDVLARGLLTDAYAFERVYAMGSFTLSRFRPPFRRDGREQHIGETITDHKGRVAYLKTFRLSDAQTRRGHLLDRLSENDWHLERTARAMRTTYEDLVRRVERAGFGSMLDTHAVRRRAKGAR
ncbi:ARPP-2 domain-containing protein [Streptomyces sp. NPDC050504]|uniref:ARPP-2 domain-containing protein n=1 Tax=Streptomyces sp. NPDC050504 TaxID=3365618 RepID=UPI00378EB518